MDISGQLQIPASLPLDKFFLVHISYGAEIFGGEKNFLDTENRTPIYRQLKP